MTNPTPFYITNAFTREPFGGNPAAVVFLQEDLPTETLRNIAKNFNQPMTTFLSASHTEAKAKTKNFRVRWFTTAVEIGLCGHATLAAAGSVFTTQDPQASIEVINFETKDGRIVSAKWVGGRVEISLPSATVEQPVHEKQEKLKAIVRRGIGKDSATVHFVGTGRKGFEEYMMVEIDETDELADCQINHAAFLETGYNINIVTSRSSYEDALFVSRMFAPAVEVDEDHVCGSAHCLLVPYWSEKIGIQDEGNMLAKQVSLRGGELEVAWKAAESKVVLRGEVRITMKGEIYIE